MAFFSPHKGIGVVALVAAVTAAACASTGGPARPSPFPNAPVPAPWSVSTLRIDPAPLAADVIQTALRFQGVPYRLGGEIPDTGFDCSGFVRYVFAAYHVDLPRTVSEQFVIGMRVGAHDVRPGDLLFFSTIASGPSHVGIATGSARFIHAPGANGVVRLDNLDAPYWHGHLIGVRRLL